MSMMTKEDCFVGAPVMTDTYYGELLGPKMDDNYWRVKILGPLPDCEEPWDTESVVHIKYLTLIG